MTYSPCRLNGLRIIDGSQAIFSCVKMIFMLSSSLDVSCLIFCLMKGEIYVRETKRQEKKERTKVLSG